MRKILLIALAVFSVLAVTGCAAIFSGSVQAVVFSAPEGTKIYMDGIKIAEIPAGYDAVSVRIQKDINGSAMIARREGYKDAYFHVKGRVNGMVFVNILLGPGLLIGVPVDLLTGAAVNYPNYIEIEMEPLPGYVPSEKQDTSLDHLLRF